MKKVHFIGIGGTGISAIARVLLEKGWQVSGSDLNASPYFETVTSLGANTVLGHDPALATQADLVVRSSAVKDDDPEVQAALAQGIPVLKRSEFLPFLLKDHEVLAVAGSHGKTTTTAMLIHLFDHVKADISFILGADIKGLNKNAHAGADPVFVIEADEYDHMFLGLEPVISVITNIEYDHPDFFPTPEIYTQAFIDFSNKTLPQGKILVSADDVGIQDMLQASELLPREILSYGFGEDADYQIINYIAIPGSQSFELSVGGCEIAGPFKLNLPGKFNVLNAAAALAAAHLYGMDLQKLAGAFDTFEGTSRRFDLAYKNQNLLIFNDYGHHPSQLSLTIEGARQLYPDHTIWAVWEPHTISRTKRLHHQFAEALEQADRAVILKLYGARESDDNYSPESILADVCHKDCVYLPTNQEATEHILANRTGKDLVIVFSAGKGPEFTETLRRSLIGEATKTQLPMEKLREVFGSRLQENVYLDNYTTTRVGGPAAGLISINSAKEMEQALKTMWELDVPYYILGSGSNLLISDAGYHGIILHNRAHNIKVNTKVDPPLVTAESGAGLGQFAQMASRRGVGGFEWANSIPGTVGGAVYGNAGAHGSDVSEKLQSALIITREKGTQRISNEEMGYQYRSSKFKRDRKQVVILEATFVGHKSDPEESLALLHELTEKRRKTQPVGPSFGSTFKNPAGNFAGKLLAEAGMKGVTCGNASFSTVHANFIVNNGGASAQDYYCLIQQGKKRVKEQFGVDLSLEIELLGEFQDVE